MATSQAAEAQAEPTAASALEPEAITAAVADNIPALAYVRPLYQDEQPLGFLRMQLANNPLAVAQQSIWQRLEQRLSWLLPLCLLLGVLLGMLLNIGLQHWRERRELDPKDETQ